MKILDHTQKDTKATDTKNHFNHGLFQERKKVKGISKQTR